MSRRRKPLHIVQFVAGLAMFPLAVWFYLKADYLGVGLAVFVGAVVLASTVMHLFGRQEP